MWLQLLKEKRNLNPHIAKVHDEKKTLNSELCDFKSAAKNDLKKHVISVHEDDKLKCKFCDYNASQIGSMNRYMSMVHEGKNSFKCEIFDIVSQAFT